MKVFVSGVKVIRGKSNATGADFTIARVHVLAPVENGGGAKVKSIGYGFEPSELELAEGALGQFQQFTFPAEMELAIEVRSFRGEMKPVCVGVRTASAPVGAK